ncbi:HNH endonuclease [Chloroflexota bacterium]
MVTYKLHNQILAKELWGLDDDGQTWEYIYFVDDIKKQQIIYQELRKKAEYKDGYNFYRFNVCDEDRSQKIIEAFALSSEIYLPTVSKEQFVDAINALAKKGTLDKKRATKTRDEQDYLRRHLFQGKRILKCGICNREYPISFLIAAHIKKRSECSLDEQADVESIVMPMCSFGCDYLYEKGYIAIKNGKVVNLNKNPTTSSLQQYLTDIINNNCPYWNDGTIPYFKWHYERHSLSV